MSDLIIQNIIKKLVRDVVKNNITYSQTQYIIKEVRNRAGLKPSKSKKGTVTRLSREEYDRFLIEAYRKKPFYGLMVYTLFDTATRVNEFTQLQVEDIYFDELKIVIREGKGDKRREIPITSSLCQLLQTHIGTRKTGAIFRTSRGKGFSDRRIQQIMTEITKLAEITSLKVSPHILRHTKATFMAEDGVPNKLIQHFLGHEDSKTTEIYIRTANVKLVKGYHEIYSK